MRKIWEFISSASQSRTTAVLVILVIAAAVPLTVLVAQRQQNYQQKADQGYCAAQTNPAFCTAANGCAWDSSATYTGTGIPPSTPGACVSTGSTSGTGTSTGTGSTTTGGTTTTTNQTTYSCQGNQICISTNGGTPNCTACTNGLNCVMTAGTPTCTGTPASTGGSNTTTTAPSCTITANQTSVNSGGTVILTLATQNTSQLGSCRVVDQNGKIQDPTTLNPFGSSVTMTTLPITYNSTFSLECPVGTKLCSSNLVTVNGTTGTTTTTTSGNPCNASGQCSCKKADGTTENATVDLSQCKSPYSWICDPTKGTICSSANSTTTTTTTGTYYCQVTGITGPAGCVQVSQPCSSYGYNTCTPSATTTTTTAYSRADLDRDHDVDIFDHNILISCSIFGKDNKAVCSTFFGNADLNASGVVDEIDYNTWLRIQKGTST